MCGCSKAQEDFGDGAGVSEGRRPLFLVVVHHDEEHHEEADGEGDVTGCVADALSVFGSDGDFVGFVDDGDGEISVF